MRLPRAPATAVFASEFGVFSRVVTREYIYAVAQLPAAYLFEALARRSEPENQLTEVLAYALSFDHDLSAAVLIRLGIERRVVDRVRTQVATGVGLRTMDMCLTLEVDVRTVSEVWCEHKLNSRFGHEQLEDYERALTRRRQAGADVRLLVILLNDPRESEAALLARMGAVVWRWGEVADVLDSVLTQLDRHWFQTAARRDASVQVRVLAELAIYLQEVAGVAVMEPFDADKLAALQNIDIARQTVHELLTRVADGLHRGCSGKAYSGRSAEETWLTIRATGWWNRLPGGTLYLWIAPTAWFSDDAEVVPSFGVSVQIDETQRSRLLGDETFVAALDEAGLRLGQYEEDDVIDVSRSTPLETLVGRSLSEQSAELLLFARRAIRDLITCVPRGLSSESSPKGVRKPDMLKSQGLL